jgi:transposase
VLESKIIQTDDTTLPTLDADRGKTKTGRVWVYLGDKTQPYTVYDYTGNRSREGPSKFLEGYKRYLQSDAYSGYDPLF